MSEDNNDDDFFSLEYNFQIKEDIKTKDNPLYINIFQETNKISLYLDESINNFHLLFEQNLNNFEEALIYLEKVEKQNKCICAAYIGGEIPGWRCIDCLKVKNGIICNKCFMKSKNLHKNHNIICEISTSGMCDCGDPNVLKTFCPEHKGPYKDEKEVNELLAKIFSNNIIINLKKFFDDFFLKFSKYLILTEKCEFFIKDIFNEEFMEKNNDEKKDIIFLKNKFCNIFSKFIDFLYSISENNHGIFLLL